MNRASLFAEQKIDEMDRGNNHRAGSLFETPRREQTLQLVRRNEGEDDEVRSVRSVSGEEEALQLIDVSGYVEPGSRVVATRQNYMFPASSTCVNGDDAAQHLERIQAKLNQHLGPEYVVQRPGPGGQKFSYVEAYDIIEQMNEIFGFNGWSSLTKSVDVEYCDETGGGVFNIGVSAIVRVTLRDGTYHEDTGFGSADKMKKGQGIEKARKEAVTDATKRAIRLFGNAVGNCIYDKKFTRFVSTVKPQAPKFDVASLKRGPDKLAVAPNDHKGLGQDSRSAPETKTVDRPNVSRATARQQSPTRSSTTNQQSVAGRSWQKAPSDERKGPPPFHPSHTKSPSTNSSAHTTPSKDPHPPLADPKEERLRQAAAKKAALEKRNVQVRKAECDVPAAEHVRVIDAAIKGTSYGVNAKVSRPSHDPGKHDTMVKEDGCDEIDFDALSDVTPSQINSMADLESSSFSTLSSNQATTAQSGGKSSFDGPTSVQGRGKRAEYVPLHHFMPEMQSKRTRY